MRYLAQSSTDPRPACEVLAICFSRVENDFNNVDEAEIPVYRRHQPQWWSPCMVVGVLGIKHYCKTCATHKLCKEDAGQRCSHCFRKGVPECEFIKRAKPAYSVPRRTAMSWVKDGLARWDRGVLVLTFNRATALGLSS